MWKQSMIKVNFYYQCELNQWQKQPLIADVNLINDNSNL